MLTRNSTLADIRKTDKVLWETMMIIGDYLSILGRATNAEIRSYMEQYNIHNQLYRFAATGTLEEMGFATYDGDTWTITEKWGTE